MSTPQTPPGPARDNAATATGWSRRSFLAAGASWSVVLLGVCTASLGCARGDGRTELLQAIQALYGDPEAAGPIARASGWDLEQALGVLTSGAPVAPAGEGVRQRLEERIRRDFVDDHIQLVDLRWLSDTEVAIAVVLSKKPH